MAHLHATYAASAIMASRIEIVPVGLKTTQAEFCCYRFWTFWRMPVRGCYRTLSPANLPLSPDQEHALIPV